MKFYVHANRQNVTSASEEMYLQETNACLLWIIFIYIVTFKA